jgi:hypothetical protein
MNNLSHLYGELKDGMLNNRKKRENAVPTVKKVFFGSKKKLQNESDNMNVNNENRIA